MSWHHTSSVQICKKFKCTLVTVGMQNTGRRVRFQDLTKVLIKKWCGTDNWFAKGHSDFRLWLIVTQELTSTPQHPVSLHSALQDLMPHCFVWIHLYFSAVLVELSVCQWEHNSLWSAFPLISYKTTALSMLCGLLTAGVSLHCFIGQIIALV